MNSPRRSTASPRFRPTMHPKASIGRAPTAQEQMDAAQRRIDAAGVDEDFASEMRRAVSDEPDSTTLLRQVVANQQEILRRLAVHESHLAKIAGTLDDLVGPAPEPADAEITVAPAPEGASDSDGDADPEAPEAPLAEEASDEPPQAS